MTLSTTPTRILTHSGEFHCDDVFAVAFLMLLVGDERNTEIIRTRDEAALTGAKADANTVVVDVGGEYSAALNNFDHHQRGGAGEREDGVPYSSFGLVWTHLGLSFCEGYLASNEIEIGAADLHALVDRELVQGVDAVDTGSVEPRFRPQAKSGALVDVLTLSKVVFALNPQPLLGECDYDNAFTEAVVVAMRLFASLLASCAAKLVGRKLIKAGRREDDRIVVVDANVPDWSDVVSDPDNGFAEALFYLDPDGSTPGAYMIWQVPVMPRAFRGRKRLPASWAGLRGEDLDAVTGIPGGNFCHAGRFVGGGKSLEAAIALAKAAVLHEEG